MKEEYISGEEHQARMQQEKLRQGVKKKPNQAKKWVLIAIVGLMLVGVGFVASLAFTSNAPSSGTDDDATPPITNGNGAPPPGGSTGEGPTTCMGSSCGGSQPSTQSGFSGVITPGKVTAVTTTSITLTPQDGGSEITFRIVAETQTLTVDPAKGSNSGVYTAYKQGDVKLGDSIAIIADSADSTQAKTVLTNYQIQTQQD
jgi:hypothetical protein